MYAASLFDASITLKDCSTAIGNTPMSRRYALVQYQHGDSLLPALRAKSVCWMNGLRDRRLAEGHGAIQEKERWFQGPLSVIFEANVA